MSKTITDLNQTIKVCERSIVDMEDAIATKDYSRYRYCTQASLCEYMIGQYLATIAECNRILHLTIKPEDLA